MSIEGPYIVWENYGYEGWKPTSFSTLAEALTSQKFNSEWEITKKIRFEVNELGEIKTNGQARQIESR